jgi:hypothetical protein
MLEGCNVGKLQLLKNLINLTNPTSATNSTFFQTLQKR